MDTNTAPQPVYPYGYTSVASRHSSLELDHNVTLRVKQHDSRPSRTMARHSSYHDQRHTLQFPEIIEVKPRATIRIPSFRSSLEVRPPAAEEICTSRPAKVKLTIKQPSPLAGGTTDPESPNVAKAILSDLSKDELYGQNDQPVMDDVTRSGAMGVGSNVEPSAIDITCTPSKQESMVEPISISQPLHTVEPLNILKPIPVQLDVKGLVEGSYMSQDMRQEPRNDPEKSVRASDHLSKCSDIFDVEVSTQQCSSNGDIKSIPQYDHGEGNGILPGTPDTATGTNSTVISPDIEAPHVGVHSAELTCGSFVTGSPGVLEASKIENPKDDMQETEIHLLCCDDTKPLVCDDKKPQVSVKKSTKPSQTALFLKELTSISQQRDLEKLLHQSCKAANVPKERFPDSISGAGLKTLNCKNECDERERLASQISEDCDVLCGQLAPEKQTLKESCTGSIVQDGSGLSVRGSRSASVHSGTEPLPAQRVLNSESAFERYLRTTLDPKYLERRFRQENSNSSPRNLPSQRSLESPSHSIKFRSPPQSAHSPQISKRFQGGQQPMDFVLKPIPATEQLPRKNLGSHYSTGNLYNLQSSCANPLLSKARLESLESSQNFDDIQRALQQTLSESVPVTESLPRTPPAMPTTNPPAIIPRVAGSRANMRSRAARRKRMALSLDLSLVLDVVLKDSHSTALTLDSEDDGGHPSALLAVKSRHDDASPSSSTTSGRSSAHSRPLSLNEYDLCQDSVSLLKAELKVVSKQADQHRSPDQSYMDPKVQRLPQMTSRSSDRNPEVKMSSAFLPPVGHDYDRIKAECDRMNNELQSLEKKYDQAVKTSNMYRQQFKVTKDKLEQVSSELDVAKSQRDEVAEEKNRLDGEVVQLTRLRDEDRSELTELRRQHREVMSESGSFDGFSAIYDQAVSRYESLKIDYDELRKQYTEAVASVNAGSAKLDRLQDDNDRKRKQCDKLQLERADVDKKHKILHQHVTSAIQASNREKNDLHRELHDMKMERDMYRKKTGLVETQTMQMSKDMGGIKKERDAVLHEYTLVMSERDSVHKEMEQLQDKLTATEKKAELYEKEKKSAKDELETLQREVSGILEMRDRAVKQLNELKDKYGERRMDPLDRDLVKDLDRLLPERGSGRRDQKDMVERRDHDKELEGVRKELEKIQTELTDTVQEKEDCKRRCDWAFTERDKIVRERESIRTLCDKLRHERDNAVSKLIEALRDTDELKKQKLDAIRELKDIKEKYDSLLEKESRKGQLHAIGHNHSHDSAIDADLQEWETETLQLEIGDVTVPDLGIDLVGGREDPQFPDNAVFVANVRQDSCAWGKLKVNDQLVKVNNMEITSVEKSVLYQAIHNSGNTVQMMVRRRRMVSTRCILPVHINLSDNELGVQLESGVYVCRILPGSAAAKEGNLAVGDRIVGVNGQSVDGRNLSEVMRLAESHGDHVTFNIIKYNLTPQSSIVLSSTPSSGHNLTESSPDGLSLSPRSPQLHQRGWVSQSPDSVTKNNLSLKCSGSQTDSLDSPQPSMHSGWTDIEKNMNHEYQANSTPQDYGDRKRVAPEKRDLDYVNRDAQYGPKDYMSGSLLRHRSHDIDAHRMPDRGQDRGRRSGSQDPQNWSHDHQGRSKEAVDRRSHESQDQGLYDLDPRRSHDQADQRRSHDKAEWRSHDQEQKRSHDPREARKSHGDSDKRNVFDKAMSRFQKSSQSTDRATRDGRCKSGHPFFNISTQEHTTEKEVIEQLNAMITHYEKQPSANKKDKRKRDKTRRENGGTWPKCSNHVDHTHPLWLPPVVHKERPPLANMLEDNPKHSTPSSFSNQEAKMPPTPPERNDSFKRSASIKHSPQSSDSSKYSHHSLSSQSKTLPAQSYHSSPSKPLGHPPISQEGPKDTKPDSSWGVAPQQENYDKVPSSVHYPTHSSSESTSTDNVDYSVKSANSKLDKMYIRQQHRPISAPNNARGVKMKTMRTDDRRRDSGDGYSHRSTSRSRDVDQKLQQIAEMLNRSQTTEAQKPTSLDVQPMYSPRPIPHTSKTITPSHPVTSPSYSQPLPGKSNTLSPSGSGALSLREKGGSSSHEIKSPGYPSSVSAQTQVMRATQPVFHVANSQLVSPQSSGSISGLPTTPSPMSSQPVISRYSSPTGPYMRGSGSSILNSSIPEVETENMGVYHIRDRLSTPSPSPSQQSSNLDHSVTTSDDFPYDFIHQRPMHGRHSHHMGHVEGSSTVPNRRPNHAHHPERIRIPSNQSIPHRSITNSFERVSGRSSPVSPAYLTGGQVEYTHLAPGTSHSLPCAITDHRRRARPRQGETREIKVEKSMEPLGIQIQSGTRGGIFVSSVSDNSLASRAGITVGDQLLEVCGINMRNATKDLAASVLRQCGGSVNMLVQYKPNKYQDDGEGSSGPSAGSSESNTPEISQKHNCHRVSNETLTSDTVSPQTLSPSSVSPLHSTKPSEISPPVEPRFVMLKKSHPHENLGITLIGGNSVGIFVRSVQPSSVSGGPKGLRYGDQLLEYNGINFRGVTQEQALVEISKPAEVVSILAQYNIQRLNKILDQPGDAFYIRALFDHQANNENELNFSKNDILFVDNTMFNSKMGVWQAWMVDDAGNKLQCGTIPSKSRLEEELSLKRSQSEVGEDELSKSSRRGSASARRSFFRKKKHQRSNSRDSRELNSFSDASINSDFLDDGAVLTFERVERLDSKVCRPVLLLAPHAEPLSNKLTSESPDKYCRCDPEVIKATMSSLETGQNEGLFVDFKARSDGQFECVTVQSVKDIISKNRHCMLTGHPTAIEHLHKVNIYPIVLFIKHKSSKEIRDVKDTRFLPEKLSQKAVKELFDTFQKYEQKYKRLFSETIPGGNLAYMCRMVKTAIDAEQKKTLWVPSGYL